MKRLYINKNYILSLNYLLLKFYFLLCFIIISSVNIYSLNNYILKFGHISVEDPTETLKKYKPLLDIISKETGYDIILIQKKTYSEMNEAFLKNEIDIGILNSFSYIKIAEKASLIPVARRVIEDSSLYQSYIIVKKDSNIRKIEDLKGKKFAFSDPNSTTGYLLPKLILLNNGINIEKDLDKVLFIGKHDSVVYAILNRTSDAGAIASYIFKQLDMEIKNNIYILYKSEFIPLGPFVVKKDLDYKLIAKLKILLLDLHNSKEGLYALESAKLNRFEEANDSDYDIIRKIYNLSPGK